MVTSGHATYYLVSSSFVLTQKILKGVLNTDYISLRYIQCLLNVSCTLTALREL